MTLLSHIRHSFTAQITLCVVGFAAVVLVVILLVLAYFLHPAMSQADNSELAVKALLMGGWSLIVLLLLCWWVISRHLHPLDLLAASAQHIADSELDESQRTGAMDLPMTVPNSGQKDEIGQLQNSFSSMQRSLTNYMAEMQQKRDTLSRQNSELQAAYTHASEADSIKARFVGQMTEQMGQTVEAIEALTNRLCDHHAELSKTEMMKIQIQMLSYTETVTSLLDQMLNSSTPSSSMP